MKHNVIHYTLILALGGLLAACQPPGSSTYDVAEVKDDSEKLVKVGDAYVTENMADAYSQMTRRRALSELSADERSRLLDDVVNVRVAALKAEQLGLDKTEKAMRELAFMRDGYLAQTLMRQHSEETPIDDAKLQAAYEERIAGMPGKEYHARHILLRTLEDAEAVIAELDGGGDFADLATQKSTGPTASRGGDLGWFTPDRMVKEFSDAVIAMNAGEYSKTPVQTQFGFHVIFLEESRDAQPPGLDQLRPQLQAQLEQQRAIAYMDALKADIAIEQVEKPANPANP